MEVEDNDDDDGDAALQHTKCVFLTECDVAGHWIRYGKH